jgi:hypothetical protein
MSRGNIEIIQGHEQHSSYWGKFFCKGLEAWEVKEEFSENEQSKHCSYWGTVANGVPEDTIFSVYERSGDKRGTQIYIFTLCRVTSEVYTPIEAEYGSGKIWGNFEVIVQAVGKVKAPRLLDWWKKKPLDVGDLQWAIHCKECIQKRGIKYIPPLSKTEAKLTQAEIEVIEKAIARGCRDQIESML